MSAAEQVTPRASRLGSLASAGANAAGQAVWAAGQMAALIFLSHQGLQRLVGVYSVGLGVFAVATLFLGLNLRVAVSTDREGAIGYSAALRARALASAVALPLAIGAMAIVGGAPAELLAASLLVAARVPDQLSDVVTGFYLRDDRQGRISRSYLVRGAAAVGVVAVAWIFDLTVLAMAALMVVAAVATSLGQDLLPERRRHRHDRSRSIADLVRSTWAISPYPALDSLHVNSLRFTLVATTGPAFYGLVAIAQILYTPFQIMMNALGFGYLQAARRAHDGGGGRLLWRHAALGLALGALIGGGFVATCLLLPDFIARLLFADQATAAAGPLRVAAIALGVAPLCGFLSICVVTGADRRSYLAAPIAGLVLVWAGTGLVLIEGSGAARDSYSTGLIVAWIFAASFALRALLSLRALAATVGPDRTAGTGRGDA